MICQSEVFIVCGHTALGNCITLVNRFSTERTRVGMCASFYYSIEPLNLSNFLINLATDFKILQFC